MQFDARKQGNPIALTNITDERKKLDLCQNRNRQFAVAGYYGKRQR